MEWMMKFVSKIFEVEELVLDIGAWTLATITACLQLFEHCRIVLCGKTLRVFRMRSPLLMKGSAKPVLTSDSDVAGSEKEIEPIEVFVKDMEALTSRRRVDS